MEQTNELHATHKYTVELRKLPVTNWGVRKVQHEIWLFLNKIFVKGWGIDERDYQKEDLVSYSFYGTEAECHEQRAILNKTFSKEAYFESLKHTWFMLKNKFRRDKITQPPETLNGWEDLQEKIAAFGIVIDEKVSLTE